MRDAPIPVRLRLLAVVLVLAGALLVPSPAEAQALFDEFIGLESGSSLSLQRGRTRERHDDSTVPANDSTHDGSSGHADALLRKGAVGLGGQAMTSRNHRVASGFEQSDQSDSSGAVVLLAFKGVFTRGNDALALGVTTYNHHDVFMQNGYKRQIDALITAEQSIVYQLGFLLVGFGVGHEHLQLRVNDPSVPSFTQEFYEYRYWLRALGLLFGDPAKNHVRLVLTQKNTPFVSGTTIDKEGGFYRNQEIEVQWRAVKLTASQTHLRSAFTGAILDDKVKTETSFGLMVGKGLTLSISHSRNEVTQGLTVLGAASVTRDDAAEDALKFEFKF